MSDTVGGPTLHTIRGPATNVVLPPRLRRTAADTTFRRLENTPLGVTPSRSGLKRKLPSAFSAILLFVGSIGWCWPVFNELRSPVLVSPAEASIHPHISRCQRLNWCRGKADSEIGKLDPFRSSTYAPSANPHVTGTSLGPESPARIVAREPSSLRTRVAARGRASAKHAAKEPKPNLKVPVRLASLERAAPRVEAIPLRILSNAGAPTSRDREKPDRIVTRELSRLQTRAAERNRALAKHAAKEPAKPSLKPPVRLASLEGTALPVQAIPSRIPSDVGALTSLVNFETAPFPYHGAVPDSGQPFLNAGIDGHWGHVNFRGDVLWEFRLSVMTACSCTFRQTSIPNAPR